MLSFEGKSIFFIGDSITADGLFLQYLRMHFKKTGHRIFLHNKGIPGGTTYLVGKALDEELADFTPDYAIVALGVNDMWYWEYDANPVVTDEFELRRATHKRVYMEGLASLVLRLQERGITPILCSPFPVNCYMVGDCEIETVVDSKEKNAITNQFYHSVTFGKINATLKELSLLIQAYAEANGFCFFDMFHSTLDAVTGDCFIMDGIHYSAQGNALLARLFLKNMLGEELTLFALDEDCQALAAREFDERAYYFVKYNIIGSKGRGLSDEALAEVVAKWIAEKGNVQGLTKKREESFFRVIGDHAARQNALIRAARGEL